MAEETEREQKKPWLNRVRDWRRTRGMTLENVYDLTGLNRSEVSKIEMERRPFRSDKCLALAKALRVAPRDLMRPDDPDAEKLLRTLPVDPDQVLGGPTEPRKSAHLPAIPGLVVVPIRGIPRGGKLEQMDVQFASIAVTLPNVHGGEAYAVLNPRSDILPINPGDTLIVTPNMPAWFGDLVLVPDGAGTASIKVLQPNEAPEKAHKVSAILKR